MSRPSGVIKNDQVARDLWGDAYAEIPKSVFAAIAWHLANLASPSCDAPGEAEARFLEEWDALLSHGLSTPSASIRQWHDRLRASRQAGQVAP